MGHQAVLRTSRRFSTQMKPSSQSLDGKSLEEHFILRETAVQALVELDSIESDALVARGKPALCRKSYENNTSGQINA